MIFYKNSLKYGVGIIISIITIFFLIGCEKSSVTPKDSNSNNNNTNNNNLTEELRNSTTITGKAIDGYLQQATVCLDLNKDGNCTSDEPLSLTNGDGNFSLDVNRTHKAHTNYGKASIVIYGGIDKDTGSEFKGKLKTIFKTSKTTYNISPVTTLLESTIRDGNKTESEAEVLVSKMLGINIAHLNEDPIKLAETNSTLLKASLQIHKSLEMVSSVSTNTVENLYQNLANNLIDNADSNLTVLIQKIITLDSTINDANRTNVIARTKTLIIQIEITITITVANTQNIGNRIQYIQNEIQDKNETQIADVNFTAIRSYSFAEMRARNILVFINQDYNATTASNIIEVLGDTQLTREEEITKLKADDKTRDIGYKLEEEFNRRKEASENAQPSNSIITLPLDFYRYANNILNSDNDGNSSIIGIYNYLLESNLTIKQKRYDFNESSNSFEQSLKIDNKVLFIDGTWKEDNTFTLSADKLKIYKDVSEIRIIRITDLSNNSNFSQGAKKYKLGQKYVKDKYTLNYLDSNNSSLLQFIKTDSRFYNFNKDSAGNILDGNGTVITELSANTSFKDNNNTWEIKKLPNSNKLILLRKSEYSQRNFYTIKDEKVYRGNLSLASNNEKTSEHYNKIAIEDMKKIVIDNSNINDNTFTLPFNFFQHKNSNGFGAVIFKNDMTSEEKKYEFNQASKSFQEIPEARSVNGISLEFIDGNWTEKSNIFTLSADKKYINTNGKKFRIVRTTAIYDNKNFSKDAKKYVLGVTDIKDSYSLEEIYSENYSSLLQFIKTDSRFYNFNKDSAGNILDGNGAVITELSANTSFKDNNNTWEIRKLPNSDKIIIVRKSKDSYGKIEFYTIKDTKICKGYFEPASSVERMIEGYNQIAFEAIKKIVIENSYRNNGNNNNNNNNNTNTDSNNTNTDSNNTNTNTDSNNTNTNTDSNNTNTHTDSNSTTNSLTPRIVGKVIDGYIKDATVCLDLNKDGKCTSDEPISITNNDANFSLEINGTHRAHSNYATASIVTYGGIDKDTGNGFDGKLKTIFKISQTTYNISPVTTLLESIVKDHNKTEAQAKILVSTMLDLNITYLNRDPIQLAGTYSKLLRASLQLEKSLEIISSVSQAENYRQERIENLYKNLAKNLITNADKKLTALIENIITENNDINSTNKTNGIAQTKILISQIEEIIEGAVTNTQEVANTIALIKYLIKNKNEIEIGAINFDTIQAYGFAETRARNILIFINQDDNATNISEIKRVLGNDQLSREEEIIKLKADDKTQNIGDKLEAEYENVRNRYKNQQLLINPSNHTISLPINANFYNENDLKINSTMFKSNMTSEYKKVFFNESSKTFEEQPKDNDLYFRDGDWKERLHTFTVSSDNKEIYLRELKLRILNEIDLVGNNHKFKNKTFSQDAKKYIWGITKLKDKYTLKNQAHSDRHSSLLDFIKDSNESYFGINKDFEGNLLDEDNNIITELSVNTSFKNNNNWEIKKLPTVDKLIFVSKSKNKYEERALYTIKDNKVYIGSLTRSSSEEKIRESYNQIAIEDIKKIIIENSVNINTDSNNTNTNTDSNNTNTNTDSNSSLTPFQKSTLDEHNRIRGEIFQGDLLVWDQDLQKLAEDYASTLASRDTLTHDPKNEEQETGENLYSSSGTQITSTQIMTKWFSEKVDYTYSNNSCATGKVCGHYTQIIWKNTSKVGCAVAQKPNQGGWVAVCKYKTPGNYTGQKPY